MDISKLTQLELIELNVRIEIELKEYNKRDKIKVFRVSNFGEASYFSTAKKAEEYIYYLIEEYDFEEMITDENLIISVDYMNKSEFDKWIKE